MKFPDLRKHFFANLSMIWFYFCVFLCIKFENTEFEPYSHNVFPSAKDICAVNILLCFLRVIVFVLLTVLELLIRKFIVEKKFPNFKLNIKIKLPKVIVFIYNVIFSIGFISACVVALLGLLFLVTYHISDMILSF